MPTFTEILHRFILAQAHHSQALEPEDLVQDLLYDALRGRVKISYGSAQAYLKVAVRRRAITQHRHAAYRPAPVSNLRFPYHYDPQPRLDLLEVLSHRAGRELLIYVMKEDGTRTPREKQRAWRLRRSLEKALA